MGFSRTDLGDGIFHAALVPLAVIRRRGRGNGRKTLREGCRVGEMPVLVGTKLCTAGEPMPFWGGAENIVAQVEPPSGPEWVQLPGYELLAATERPRLVASGELEWHGDRLMPERLAVHRDDLVVAFTRGSVPWTTSRLGAAVALARRGVIQLTGFDATRRRLCIDTAGPGLTAEEAASLGAHSFEPETRSLSIAFPRNDGSGFAIASTRAECERAGYTPLDSSPVWLDDSGRVRTASTALVDPAAAATSLGNPSLARLKAGMEVQSGIVGFQLAFREEDLPRLRLQPRARVGFGGGKVLLDEISLRGIAGNETLLGVSDGYRSIFSLPAFVAPEAVAGEFLTHNEAKARWSVDGLPRYRLFRLDQPTQAISGGDHHFRVADCAARPTLEDTAKAARAQGVSLRKSVRDALGTVPDGFRANLHTLEQARAAAAIRERLLKGELVYAVDRLRGWCDELGLQIDRVVSVLQTTPRYCEDPLTRICYVDAALTAEDLLRDHASAILEQYADRLPVFVRRIVADPAARENLLIGMLAE